jgi:hypothetical protein
VFEAVIDPRARWLLERVPRTELLQLRQCIEALERDPFPGSDQRTPLVIPAQRVYPEAYRCGG